MKEFLEHMEQNAALMQSEAQRSAIDNSIALLTEHPRFDETRELFVVLVSLITFMNPGCTDDMLLKLRELIADRSHPIFGLLKQILR